MCGIIGIVGRKNQEQLVAKGLALLKNRGSDCQQLKTIDGITFGHALHAVVDFVPQPLTARGSGAMLTANNELYNWGELSDRYYPAAKNDSELLLQYLRKNGVTPLSLELLDGVFAFGFYQQGKIIIARDILGEKPVWYSLEKGLAFASERKVLLSLGYKNVHELNPRTILSYHIKTRKVKEIRRPFFSITPEIAESSEQILGKVKQLLIKAVEKRIPEAKLGLLFSGGLDSVLLAQLVKRLGKKFTCYLSVLEGRNLKEPGDLAVGIDAAKKLGLELRIVKSPLKDAENCLRIIAPLIEDTNVTKVAVALTFFKALEEAKKDGLKVKEEIIKDGKFEVTFIKERANKEIKAHEKELYQQGQSL